MKKNNFRSDIKVLKENKYYRFSDLFFGRGIRYEYDRNTILSDNKFKDRILRKYLEQKIKEQDYDTLRKILKDYISKNDLNLPLPSELVIHLRCGDIFTRGVKEKLVYKFIDNLLKNEKNIFSNKIDKVSIVTAMHFGANELNNKYFYSEEVYNENIKFLEFFENKINDIGYELNIVSNNDFDLDLCYMTSSNHFFKSISMVSNIIERCLDKNAKVYNKNDKS